MQKGLISACQKPALWQRSSEPFWDDEHISGQMLRYHLDPDVEAASRKHADIDRSVAWLTSVIPAGSRVLDMGCGPGLYTKRLSERGYDVTGIDISKRSLVYARGHDQLSKYVDKNYLELDGFNAFDAITLIYCDYAGLTLPERKILLPKVFRALKPGGQFILDVFSTKTLEGKRDTRSWELCDQGGFWSSQSYLLMEGKYYYAENTIEVSQYIVITESALRAHLVWNTVYSKQSLFDEVTPAGFTVAGVFDDVCGSPYSGDADTICTVLKKN